MFDIEDYNYNLPPSLIAQVPASKRDHSRLFVVDRTKKAFSDSTFYSLPRLLRSGDLIIVNDTKVVPARLCGRKESGGLIDVLVLQDTCSQEKDPYTHSCLLKSSKRPKIGSFLLFNSGVSGQITEFLKNGLVKIKFNGDRSIESLLEEEGKMPLPPYIKRKPDSVYTQLDRERYQTIFSRRTGAVAAPTAGLHFTVQLVKTLEEDGIFVVPLTLHVGYGTFRPVRTRDIRGHVLGEESYLIEPETAEAIEQTKKKGGRVVAVGTTVVRTLETVANPDGSITPGQGKTDLLITPGFKFKTVDALITNFHQPKSSLLFLVSAFAGLKLIKEAYQLAAQKGYRFYSYGDAMLIL